MIKGDQKTHIPGQLSLHDREIKFDVHGCQAAQSLAPGRLRVSMTVPEGRLELKHKPGEEPSAQRFLGDVNQGKIPMEVTATGYRLTVDSASYDVVPPLTLSVIGVLPQG